MPRCRLSSALLCAAAILVLSSPAHAQLGDNLALGKPARQSSQLGGFGPGLGVDGNLDNFTHTLQNADLPGPAWWEVDLEDTLDIGFIIIWNRTSCCGSRLRDIIVQVLADDGETVVFETTDPDAPDPDALLNPENRLGTFPLGPANLIVDIEAAEGGPVQGRFVRVLRLPDEDLSGTGGQGNADEPTVLSLGEVEVFESGPDCPADGDTHCEGLSIEGPALGDVVGDWTVSAVATDDTGDLITYTFSAEHTDGTTVTVRQDFETATLTIAKAGTWTFSVSVDDDPLCSDEAADASCSEEIDIEGLPGFTNEFGQILTKAWLVLGPFTHPFGCNGPARNLLGNHIANDRIDCAYPVEGDAVDYDPNEAVSTGYIGPEPDGIPTWRLFDDGSPENGDQDLNGDIGQRDDVMSWLVTYVEYKGADPITVDVCLGSDDGGQLWIDDRNLINDPTCRGRGDCDVRATTTLEPGVHRIAAAAWNRGGGWGLRVSLEDPQFGPIVDDEVISPDWVFHGPVRPAGFTPPECAGCEPEPVRNLTCEFGRVGLAQGLVLTWENPDVTDPLTPTRIEIDGVEVATVASDATQAGIPANRLPDGFFTVSVIHCGNVPATCSPFNTDDAGFILGQAFLVVGPFTHNHGCGGDSAELEGNHLAPDNIGCLYPEAGDEVDYDPLDPNVASTGYVGPTSPDGKPIFRPFDDGTPADGDQDLNADVAGPMDDVMSWLVTYVEYAGDDPTTLVLCFGSDDGGQIWVNDRLVHTNNICRGRGACQDTVEVPIDGPGVFRIAAAAWNRGGGWGLSLQLQDEFFSPIVDDGSNELWIFHGAQRPDGDFPCTLVPPVIIGDCEFGPAGDVELAWDNPAGVEADAITITVNGEILAELAGDATNITLAVADLPDADPLRVCVDNGSQPPACCVLTNNIALGKPADQSTVLNGFTPDHAVNGDFGDFQHTLAGNGGMGPAIWEVDLGEAVPIDRIVIHNRGDGCCQSRLRDIVVSVHDISFREDNPLDPAIAEVTDAEFPLWPDAAFESEILNEENELGGGGTDGPPTLEVDLGGQDVSGRYVRVVRIPDRDLSGTGGAGNADEGDVLQMGEVQVFSGAVAVECPAEGDPDFADTECGGLTLSAAAGDPPVDVTATANATDATGDTIRYTFTADDGAGTVLRKTTRGVPSVTFSLPEGTWTITAVVDDQPRCDDASAANSCSETIVVRAQGGGGLRVPGDCNGDATLNISDPVCLLGFLFQGNPTALPCGDGTQGAPGNIALMDANGDGNVNLSDAVWLLNFLFGGGPSHVLAVAGNEQGGCVPIEGCSDSAGCQ